MYNWLLRQCIFEQFGTQAEFASRVGLQPSEVSKVIHGRYNLTDEQKEGWATLLDKNVDKLFHLKRKNDKVPY